MGRRRRCFTLLELLVVLVVAGVLAALAAASLARVRDRALERRAETTLAATAREAGVLAVLAGRAPSAADAADAVGDLGSGYTPAGAAGSTEPGEISWAAGADRLGLAMAAGTGRCAYAQASVADVETWTAHGPCTGAAALDGPDVGSGGGPGVPPGVPEGLVVVGGAGEALAAWDARPAGESVTVYTLLWWPAGGGNQTSTTVAPSAACGPATCTATIGGLGAGTWQVTVVATNAAGASQPAPPVEVTVGP